MKKQLIISAIMGGILATTLIYYGNSFLNNYFSNNKYQTNFSMNTNFHKGMQGNHMENQMNFCDDVHYMR